MKIKDLEWWHGLIGLGIIGGLWYLSQPQSSQPPIFITTTTTTMFPTTTIPTSITTTTSLQLSINCVPIRTSSESYFSIVVIPANYASLNQFATDAQQYIQKVVDLSPNINIVRADNIVDCTFYEDKDCDYSTIRKIALTCAQFKNFRVIVLSNTTGHYMVAGACNNDVAMIFNDYMYPNSLSSEQHTILHEFGHSLGLTDEYVYNNYNTTETPFGPNCDVQGCPKWSSYYSGCVKGCLYSNWYSPSEFGCVMKGGDFTFDPICKKHIDNEITELSSPPSIFSIIMSVVTPQENKLFVDGR